MRRAALVVLLGVAGCNAILGLDAGELAVTSTGGAGGASSSAGGASSSDGGAGGGDCQGFCAPHVAGWLGPIDVIFGGECPPGFTDDLDYAVVPDVIPPATCTCGCGPVTGACSAALAFFSDTGCGVQIAPHDISSDNPCTNVPPTSGAASVSINHTAGSSPKCGPTVEVTAPPPLEIVHVCSKDVGTCGGDASCLDTGPGLQSCVGVFSASPCPPGYPNASAVYQIASIADTRGCDVTGCACDVDADPDCTGTLTTFTTSDCAASTDNATYGVDLACTVSAGLDAVTGVEYAPASIGSCQAGGQATPTGTVTGSVATVCCQ